MNLLEYTAHLRSMVDDTGIYLTHIGAAPVAAASQTIPVVELAQVQPGMQILVGQGAAVEGKLVVQTSAASGSGTATLASPLVAGYPAYSPISTVEASDDDYYKAILTGIKQFSNFCALLKEMTVEILAGTASYGMPADFIEPVQESFEEAIGKRTFESARSLSYYASIQRQVSRGTAPANSLSGDFGSSLSTNPLDNPNGIVVGVSTSTASYSFTRSATPQLLVVPTPTAAKTLVFYYRARHVAPTASVATSVPVGDEDIPLFYAKYLRCEAMAVSLAKVSQMRLGGEKQIYRNPEEMRALGKAALEEFNARAVLLPAGTLG